MPRSLQEILDHADELARRFESADFAADDPINATPLHELRDAVLARASAERTVAQRVTAARAAGIPWSVIGAYLGTSGEGARQRYGQPRQRA